MTASPSDEHAGDDHGDRATPLWGTQLTTVAEASPESSRTRGWKRSAHEWATLLDELATELGNGQFYSRDLHIIDEPIHRVAERYVRRRSE